MPDIKVGDVVRFDMNAEVNFDLMSKWPLHEPFVVVGDNEYIGYIDIKPLDGHGLPDGSNPDGSWSFWKDRFCKDIFLTAAREACENE